MFQVFQYHPAFDIYNAMFRILMLLSYDKTMHIEKKKLQIIDFYFLFPGLIKGIMVKREHIRTRNTLAQNCNSYNTASVLSQTRHVFERINPFQDLAFSQLENKGIIQNDSEDFVSLKQLNFPDEMTLSFKQIIEKKTALLSFLCDILSKYKLNGPDGLKFRTGLMESRYDVV